MSEFDIARVIGYNGVAKSIQTEIKTENVGMVCPPDLSFFCFWEANVKRKPPGPAPFPEPQQRRRIIGARVTDKEKMIIKATARRLGITVNALVYQACMEKARQAGVFEGSQSRG